MRALPSSCCARDSTARCLRVRALLTSELPEGRMLIGCHVPTTIPAEVARDAVLTFAREAEAREFASLWVSDHVVIPRDTGGYPRGGRCPPPPAVGSPAPPAALAPSAGCTARP